MRSINITTATTLTVAGLAGTAIFLMPGAEQTAQAQSTNTYPLMGVMRDFRRTNLNFAVVPSGGNGHYAGNLDLTLPSDARPVFVGGGYKVDSEWRDDQMHPIAPNLYKDGSAGGSGVVHLVNAMTAPKCGKVDTYNSTLGPYGGTNVGPAPTYNVGATMPEVTVPPELQAMPVTGNYFFHGTKTISSDMHVKRLTGIGTLKISGDVSILCDDVMALGPHSKITMMPGSRLKLYLSKGGMMLPKSMIGDPAKPGSTKIFNMGQGNHKGSFLITPMAAMHASMVSPTAALYISNKGALFGQFKGKSIKFAPQGNLHIDASGPTDACGKSFSDTAGAKGVASDGGLVSAPRFADWYADVPGTNLSMPFTMTLWKNSAGVWEHINDAFFPLDKKLFANQGQLHNYYFTYTASAQFTHHACSGTFVEFTGNDDVWMFIDDKLVMDRGGVLPGFEQYVPMDRLGLEDGKVYRLNIFYAQRNASTSVFRLRTNVDLLTETNPPVLQMSMGAD